MNELSETGRNNTTSPSILVNCGTQMKVTYNLPEYTKRNPGRSVVPQHVVRFASGDRNLDCESILMR